MLFNSLEFVIFFPLVTLLYFVLPYRYRWLLLLTASCVFYMFFVPVYILILAGTIVIDYTAGILIEEAGHRRKAFLVMSLAANIGVLAVFKYYNFLVVNLEALAQGIGWHYSLPLLGILLPIGLSFHTFQAMSYTIEVYRGNQKAERHFGIFALYVMYYPQLVAGPIERPQNILPQLKAHHDFDEVRVANGLKRMLWGMFKKVVIADRLALYVGQVFDHPDRYHSGPVWLATFFFAFQIYCDFSGYTDIAHGASEVMGIRLMTNFNRPYSSRSIAEFWKRWHISLSTWFRDYLYIPMGGNRVSKGRHLFNLFFTFLISGLWHGASWNFILWGALHGAFLVLSIVFKPFWNLLGQMSGIKGSNPLADALNTAFTFILVCFAWIFFRAPDLSGALTLIRHGWQFSGSNSLVLSGFGVGEIALSLALILFMETIHRMERREALPELINTKPVVVRWGFYHALLLGILLLGVFSRQQFIYFQF